MFSRTTLSSPVGELLLIASDAGLRAVLWPGETGRVATPPHVARRRHPIIEEAAAQLEQYFAGERTRFDVLLDPVGTEFQRRVWDALREIPYGETSTYGTLATALGRPTASRAVGAANGRNPISIIVPCHRVVSSSGALTGFAGGLNVKRTLLDHESGATSLMPPRP